MRAIKHAYILLFLNTNSVYACTRTESKINNLQTVSIYSLSFSQLCHLLLNYLLIHSFLILFNLVTRHIVHLGIIDSPIFIFIYFFLFNAEHSDLYTYANPL